MSDAILIVENLGKRFRLTHRVRQSTLRDTLSDSIKGILRRRAKDRPAHEDFWALKDVSFTVDRGEVVGIIGRNGSGKSTMLKVLSRITEPTTGRVRIRGRVASLLEVGTGFHPELTGRENIFLNGVILGMRKAEVRERFDEIVAFAEVERFLDTPVKHYSSGMYVRLAFAVAAHLDTEILIVDEVLAVGDAAFQRKCLAKMQQVAVDRARTVLFVSHNLPIVEKVCSRGLLMESGTTTGVGPISEVISRYISAIRTDSQRDLTAIKSKSITLAHLCCINADGSRGLELQAEQPGVLEIAFDVPGDCKDVDITVAFTNVDGQRLFALSSAAGGTSMDLEKGLNTIRIRFTMPSVFAGTFSLDVGVYAHLGDTLFENYGANFVTVNYGAESKWNESAGPSFGFLKVDSVWQPTARKGQNS